MAVVENEMQQRDQGQTIDCIINIPMPIHLRSVGHRVAEKSGATASTRGLCWCAGWD